MLVSINSRSVAGPWGGASLAVAGITKQLNAVGITVVNDLKHSGINLILMIHPSKSDNERSYGIEEIIDYVAINPNTILLQRMNTSDERRGGGTEGNLLMSANRYADYTVFISQYLLDLYSAKGFDKQKPHSVILNGADGGIFFPKGRSELRSGEKVKIVTHHWSSNFMKGFDIYERLDLLLGTRPYQDLFEFAYIGNVPAGVEFQNTKIIPPLSGKALADELRNNHLYLTGSRNEPAGMHHIEGMMCGLPVLYLNSGALPEYCSPYGVEFSLINFEEKLLEARERIDTLRADVLKCNYTDREMGLQYVDLIVSLIQERQANPRPTLGLLHRRISQYARGARRTANRTWQLLRKAKRAF